MAAEWALGYAVRAMKLGRPGWLPELLQNVASAHSDERARAFAQAPGALSRRAVARAFLRRAMRESGLLFGTPRESTLADGAGGAPEEVLFLAVLRTFAELALDVAVLAGAEAGPRKEQLLALFAWLIGQTHEAEEIARRGAKTQKRSWVKVEAGLEARATSLAGDPAYGLVLHNGAVYVDARVFGLQAIDFFSRGGFHPRSAQRRREAAAREKALLVEVLTALACAERQPSFPTRRAILRQIEDLHLPAEVEDGLRLRVRRSFERRPSPAALAKGIRAHETRRFLLAQALLAARVDGRTSDEERAFLVALAEQLGFSAADLAAIELEVAEFYAQNRHVVDVFTVSAAAGVMGEEMVDTMTSALEKNFHRVMNEIRETGDLAVLLTRAATGHTLSRDERRRMREQLIDVAKAIPALAIFAAPGGVLMLIALAKVLPFSLLPSSFQDEVERAPDEKVSGIK